MTQKKVIITGRGGVEVLKIVEDEIPSPSRGEVRVRIEYAGVAFADIMMRHGVYPGSPRIPFTPGYDVSGRIDKVGGEVKGLYEGQKVIAFTRFGGYSQYICIPAERCLAIPEEAEGREAVCLVLNYVTAYQMLHRVARLRSGEAVLVHSAAGGVGTALLQLGHLMGLKVYGTASVSKHEIVLSCGGIPIDYRTLDFVKELRRLEPEGLAAVFDPLAGKSWKRSLKVLKRGGILVGFGVISMYEHDRFRGSLLGIIPRMAVLKILPNGKKFAFYGINVRKHPDWLRSDLSVIVGDYLRGLIKPVICKVFPLDEVRAAHTLLGEGKAWGKIVLDCR